MQRRLAEPHLEEVASGVHAWIQPHGTWGESNAGVVVGDGASLLVDTLWDETLTGRMLDAMAPLLGDAPIRTVVNTHADGDHWWGNAAVPPDAEIVTATPSAALMAEADPNEFVRFKRLAGALARLPGRPGAFGRYTREMLRPFRFDEVTLRPATRPIDREETLTVGGREARVVYVGPAHTPGDAIVHVPDAGVVFAADVLFVGVTPVIWAGPVANWLAALDTVLATGAERFVPGHGPVCGAAEVEELRGYWQWLEPAVAERHARGLDAWAAAREIARSADFGRYRAWRSPERLVINVTTIVRNLDGAPPSTSPVDTIRLFARVAALARELER